jgi:hypothetical protein
MGILHFRSRRATSTQTLPLRPSQLSTHSGNEPWTSHLPYHRHYSRARDIEHRENSYESTSESSGDESCCEPESEQWENSTLLSDPRTQLARQHLLPVAREQFQKFVSEVIYTEPPRAQQECGNESVWPLPMDTITEGNDQYCTSDDSFVIIPTLERYFHYRCPFHASNPRKYQSCLVHHELHSIESVIKHVKRHHARPPYCPRCSKVFETVSKCDRHILDRRCRARPLKIPDGVNFYHKSRLSKKDNHQLSDQSRWERIYKRIFPESAHCPSPYLDTGAGLAVSMVRDFWRLQGQDVISEFPGAQNWATSDQEHILVALFELVLFDLIGKIVEEG